MDEMTIFIIGGIGLSLLLFLCSVFLLCLFFYHRREIRNFPPPPKRNKQKRKRWKRRLIDVKKGQKRRLKRLLLSFVLSLLLAGGAGYARYYQAMNLTRKDSDAVAKSYYLVRDFEKELEVVKKEEKMTNKTQETLRHVTTSMASYGIEKADSNNALEGQLLLNKYYDSVKQLGANASIQINNLADNDELAASFLVDSEKIKKIEKQILVFYKVSEEALKKEE